VARVAYIPSLIIFSKSAATLPLLLPLATMVAMAQWSLDGVLSFAVRVWANSDTENQGESFQCVRIQMEGIVLCLSKASVLRRVSPTKRFSNRRQLKVGVSWSGASRCRAWNLKFLAHMPCAYRILYEYCLVECTYSTYNGAHSSFWTWYCICTWSSQSLCWTVLYSYCALFPGDFVFQVDVQFTLYLKFSLNVHFPSHTTLSSAVYNPLLQLIPVH
jgi:hypothetical protein